MNDTPVMTQELFEYLNPKEYLQNTTKNVEILWESAKYKLSWGNQYFQGPHVRVLTENPDEWYGVALKEFFDTHVPAKEYMTFRKSAVIRAVQIPKPVRIITITEDGNEETNFIAPAGAYVIKNPGENDFYTNDQEQFKDTYIPVS